MSADPLLAALAIAGVARNKILRAAKAARASPKRGLADILADMLGVESLLARALRDGQVLAWLEGGAGLVKALPAATKAELLAENAPNSQGMLDSLPYEPQKSELPPDSDGASTTAKPVNHGNSASTYGEKGGVVDHVRTDSTRPPLPPEPLFPPRPGDGPAPVRLPAIEKAAKYLQNRLAYTPEEFAQLDDEARAVGFTVAKAVSLDAVEKVRNALAEDVANGGTLRAFREKIADVIDESALSPAKVEALYRTHSALAYSAGQRDVHTHPLISSSFPYVLRSCVHDARARATHIALEQMGLNGTAVYRADDPVIIKYRSPWDWNCRCVDIYLSVADAASYGVKEAIRWLETGIPPVYPEYVVDPGFPLPRNWPASPDQLRPII